MPNWIKPRPGKSLVASAKRLTQAKLAERSSGVGATRKTADDWQSDAWDMFDRVGEQHFLATTLANRLSQARLFVGRVSDTSQTDIPEPVDADHVAALPLLDLIENSAGLQQLLYRLGVNLYMAGEGWLVEEVPADRREAAVDPRIRWHACSVDEVTTTRDAMVEVQVDEGTKVSINPDDCYVIRVWRPHPRWSWQADSSTRSSLPVLRELVGLTLHISAQVESRLAGAGVLVVPESAHAAINSEGDGDDDFIEALIEAMTTPIADRGSAAAVVPLVVKVPDESADKFKHLVFSRELDGEARELRDEAIRRLSLSQDAPPEVLLGTGNMNHWGAYLVQEDVVTTHLEPPLALICDALTSQYLRPVLEDAGVANPEDYVIWYDVSHLIVRPNRTSEAVALHQAGAITDDALRQAAGFEDSDAPEQEAGLPVHVQVALDMVQRMPSLMENPGLPSVVEQVRQALEGEVPQLPPIPGDVLPPTTPDETPTDPAIPSNVPQVIGDADGPA